MSHAPLVVKFPDGTIKFGVYERLNATAISFLFDTSEEAVRAWERRVRITGWKRNTKPHLPHMPHLSKGGLRASALPKLALSKLDAATAKRVAATVRTTAYDYAYSHVYTTVTNRAARITRLAPVHPTEPVRVEIATLYGGGFSWEGTATLQRLTSGFFPYPETGTNPTVTVTVPAWATNALRNANVTLTAA